MQYQELRNQYHTITYKHFQVIEDNNMIKTTYTYILGEYTFTPSIMIDKKNIKNKNINDNFLNYLFFNYGMVNLINYFKLTCPKKIVIEAGFINEEQIQFFKKLIYKGLGEYFYRNNIDLDYNDFTTFEVKSNQTFQFDINDKFNGNLILVGGGKDSIVSLELLKEEKTNNLCFLFERNIYPKNMPSYHSIYQANYTDDDIVIFHTEIDPLLLELNKKGFLNGHIPVSSQLAFASYIMAYLNNKKYIIVSNEASSNEGTVKDVDVNHQYSKSIEFEDDFRNYTSKYFIKDIEYFSLLRPLLEIQIAKIFSKYPKYFPIFRSCNLSSKKEGTLWCCNCSKCLFVFIVLSPYIDMDTLIHIFGENLLDKKELQEEFIELLGFSPNKPFECVGTYKEVKYACSKAIKKLGEPLPYLLKYYQSNCSLEEEDLESYFNDANHVPSKYIEKIKKELYEND